MTKRILCLLFSLSMILLLPANGFAAESDQTDPAVHLTIEYRDQSIPLTGVLFQMYLISGTNESSNQTLMEPLSAYPVSTAEDSVDGQLAVASTLEAYAQRDDIPATDSAMTDENGRLSFPSQTVQLPHGLYLVTAETHTQGDYVYEIQPFLLDLPYTDDASGQLYHDVTAKPKFNRRDRQSEVDSGKIQRKVLKLWEDDCCPRNRPEEIEVQLLRDGDIYDTVFLSEENNWSYTWETLDPNHNWQVTETVPEGYHVTITRTGTTFVIVNTCQEEGTEPTLPEQPDEELPQTGQLWWPVPVLSSLGMFLILLGLIRRRGGQYET